MRYNAGKIVTNAVYDANFRRICVCDTGLDASMIADALNSNDELTFAKFQAMNKKRCTVISNDLTTWPIELWALAIAGEAGELCNTIKKMLRGDFKFSQALPEISKELADILTYVDLAFSKLGLRTDKELMAKFEEISQRRGYKG
jgi:NTP pyrophosphatase (non-canonical NTP hydrolase)